VRKALLAVWFLALTASAETFGPVVIEPRPGVAMMRDGTYYEYRFNVLNPTVEPHAVRIDVTGNVMGNDRQPRSSRTMVIAPRTSTLVSVPQYVMEQYAPREALVTVDGGPEEKLPFGSHFQGSSYRTSRDLLLGRSVNDVLPAEAAQEDSGIIAVRPPVAPASWSANWMHYTGFAGILLTPTDWNELAPPVQTALLRYVEAGGALTFVGGQPTGLPVMRQLTDFAPVPAAAHGFGFVTLVPDKIDSDTLNTLELCWRTSELSSGSMWAANDMITPIPLLEDQSLPLKSLFSLLVVFAVVGGPVNLWVLAKKQRRLWIFWTLPLLGIITAVILVGSVIVSEGWVRIQKTTSMTLLDERTGEAATIGWTGFYSTLAPDGDVRFESGTEVRPMFMAGEAHTDWTDGQRFVAGWIGSRLARGFVVRKVEPRRERLPVRREAGHLVAINGLGATIRELWVADQYGAAWVARDVPAGKEVVLTRSGQAIDPAIKDPAFHLGAPSLWGTLQARFAKDPRSALRAGSYVAVIERSPFVEAALARPSTFSSDAVVIGFMKGIDDAS